MGTARFVAERHTGAPGRISKWGHIDRKKFCLAPPLFWLKK